MAGLFSLGGGGGGRGNQEGENQNEIPPPEPLFWYNNKNDDVSVASYRGLELWNQHQQQQHQHQHHQHEVIAHARPLLARDLYASGTALGVGVGPSRVSSDDQSSSRSAGFMAMQSSAGGGEGSGGGGISCQDCGNQAKKDCPHMRCRTCCKSRGFECQTHVKSTWVPASRRRERQQQLTSLQQRDISKRPRDLPNISSSSALRNFPSASGLEATNFPAVVSSPAEFKCVRVSSVDDADERYAYQTAVNIGGHVFKGILYDFGPETSNSNYNTSNYMVGETSNAGGGGVAAAQPLNLIADSNAAAVVSSSGTLVDPSSMYSAPINAFMTGSSGTQFFPRPRS